MKPRRNGASTAILTGAVVALMIGHVSRAVADIRPKSLETSLSGSFSSVAIGDVDEPERFFLFLAEVGSFVDSRSQVGIRAGLVSLAGEGALLFDGVYTFNFVTAGARSVPFVTASVGVSDALPLFGSLLPASSFEPHLAFGGGTRLLLGDRAAFRVEYRYERVPSEERFRKYRQHAVLFGFSIFTTGETKQRRPSPDGIGY